MNIYKISIIVALSTIPTFSAIMNANESPKGLNLTQAPLRNLAPTRLLLENINAGEPKAPSSASLPSLSNANIGYETHSNASVSEELGTQTPELFNTPEMVAPPATIIEQAPVIIQQAPVVVVAPQPQAVIPVRLISIEDILIRNCSSLLIRGNFVLGDVEIETLKEARKLAMHKKALINFLGAYEKRHPYLKSSLAKLVEEVRNNQNSYRLKKSKILAEILPQLPNIKVRTFFIKETKKWENLCKQDVQRLSNCADHWHQANIGIVKTLLDREKLISNRSVMAFLNRLQNKLF